MAVRVNEVNDQLVIHDFNGDARLHSHHAPLMAK
jgi:hypothetical protein